VLRTLNSPLHPFDWRVATASFREQLGRYQGAAGNHFNLGPSVDALDALDGALDRLYVQAPSGAAASDDQAKRFNFAQRRLGRQLVRINYSRMPEFWHDPAVTVPPLPDLHPTLTMPDVQHDDHCRNVLKTHLTRGQNRLVWTLEQARETVEAAIA
jgi:hypothetical protein